MKSRLKTQTETDLDNPEGQFKIFQVTAREAVAAGLIKQEFLESEKINQGPLYPQMYEAEFIAGGGNVFDIGAVDYAIMEGQRLGYEIDPLHFQSVSMGIDPEYGSSKFGIVITQFVGDGNRVKIMYANEWEHANYEYMVREVYYLMSKYQVDLTYVDGANPEFIRSLKIEVLLEVILCMAQ
jgi:hypothetical protein